MQPVHEFAPSTELVLEKAAEFQDGLCVSQNRGATWLYLDRNEIAEEILTSAFCLSLEVLGEKHDNSVRAMVALGEAEHRLGNYEDVERLLQRAYELSKPLPGEGHFAQSQLARTLGNDGNFKKAEVLHREFIEIHKKCSRDIETHAMPVSPR